MKCYQMPHSNCEMLLLIVNGSTWITGRASWHESKSILRYEFGSQKLGTVDYFKVLSSMGIISGWWFGTRLIFPYFPISWE